MSNKPWQYNRVKALLTHDQFTKVNVLVCSNLMSWYDGSWMFSCSWERKFQTLLTTTEMVVEYTIDFKCVPRPTIIRRGQSVQDGDFRFLEQYDFQEVKLP